MRLKIVALICMAGLICFSAFSARGASIVGSKHDLGYGGTYGRDDQVCIVCHTPHFASTDPKIQAPLWNRMTSSNNNFTLYTSPTLKSTPTQPTGVSLACLSCHDAVIGGHRGDVANFHNVINGPGSGQMPDESSIQKCESCHSSMWNGTPEKWRLGRDLRDDHPISIAYPTSQQSNAFFTPTDAQKGWIDMPLFGGKVECSSCHSVHDPSRVPFLRIANTGSALCYKCHNK
jgi:predicted CXXCH cytochrome family protein